MKICNQRFVKDDFRDKKYIGSMKCITCGEVSNLTSGFPVALKDFTSNLDAFVKLHTVKGCNKTRTIDPDWASSKIGIGIAFDNK